MTIDERIDFLQTYIDEFEKTSKIDYGNSAYGYLQTCKKLKMLGLDWGADIIFKDFRIVKGCHLINSTTHYKGNNNDYYIHWDGNISCLMFPISENWDLVKDDYQEFLKRLISYGAVDWDDLNDHIVFDIEHGKILLKDYPKIKQETVEKIKRTIKNEELARVKRRYEQLLAESGGEISGL